jgi:hypothetical protein
MIQRGQHLGFALKTSNTRRVALEFPWQNLNSHFASQLGVGCAIDLAHATGTQERNNFV